MATVIAAIAAFVVTILAIIALRPVAVAINLVDRPGGRKTHRGEVPITGGLSMFLGIVFGLGLIEAAHPILGSLLSAFALVVTVGMLDDRYDLSPWLRLLVQGGAALLLTLGTNSEISSLGDQWPLNVISIHGAAARAITVLFVVTAVNAFNMLDGMDGLAGTIAVIALGALGVCAELSGKQELAGICGVIGAATVGFLLFNLPMRSNRRLRCFMGDAGSTLLGLALAWICIRISQRGTEGSLSPVTALWIVALPLYEFFWTVFRRLGRGQSPLSADAEHFHHLLLQAGFGVRGAFLTFLSVTVLLTVTGLTLRAAGTPEYVSLLMFLAVGAVIIRTMYWTSPLLRLFPKTARRQRRLSLKR